MPIAISFHQGSRGNIGVGVSQGSRGHAHIGFTIGVGDLSTFVLAETPTGDVNGVNMDYTTASNFQKIWVYLNGVRMKPGSDFNVTGVDSFSFLYPPQTGDTLLVDYIT